MTNTAKQGMGDGLPIFDYKQKIVEAVHGNQVTIITAETGAGKSTQVPQYLIDAGYEKVIVTEPRILAARNLSLRVREEWLDSHPEAAELEIAYRTAHERDDDPTVTQVLYCTDGLQLVRELTGSGTTTKQVLVLDEVHEWNENMEVLIAWSKQRCSQDPNFKIVIMSATIESDSLAKYYGTEAVIDVPGRSYDVKKRHGSDVVSEIMSYLPNQKNLLVFLPGKTEIQTVNDIIAKQATKHKVPVIALHSQLEAVAQQAAFESYPSGKVILATNIAQTSVTIDDIDVVIDSGLERQIEVRSGVEGLFLNQVAKSDCLQRAGRAGRTKHGEYVLAQLGEMECISLDDRQDYGQPEILRKHIDRVALRLASIGVDIAELDFYHAPSKTAIKRAKRRLKDLGALDLRGAITDTGRQMEQYPVESKYGRMIVEAYQYSAAVQSWLIAIIGIQESGGIVRGGTQYDGWKKYVSHDQSDLIAEYDVYLALGDIYPEEYEDLGIIEKNVEKAEDVISRLSEVLGINYDKDQTLSKTEHVDLLRCIVAGQIDQLWTINQRGQALHYMTHDEREISNSSVVKKSPLFAGTPFDLQVPSKSGKLEVLHLVQDITRVNPTWLAELRPDVFKLKPGTQMYYDPYIEGLAERQDVLVHGTVLSGSGTPVTKASSYNRKQFEDQFALWVHEKLEYKKSKLGRFTRRRVKIPSLRQLALQIRGRAGGVVALDQLDSKTKRDLLNLARLDAPGGSDKSDKSDKKRRFGKFNRYGKRFKGSGRKYDQ